MFTNRHQAGQRLAAALKIYRTRPCVVLALPRGGVPVAAEIVKVLSAPLRLLLVRKIGLPDSPEVAMGAVIDGSDPIVVRNEAIINLTGITDDVFQSCCREELDEIHRRQQLYRSYIATDDLTGTVAIVVDDGSATGATATAAIRGLRARRPAEIVLAIPVAPAAVIAELKKEADNIVCLDAPRNFSAVGAYYRDFSQLTDEDVLTALSKT